MDNNDDIWSGGSIRKASDGKKYDEWAVQHMINSGKFAREDSGLIDIMKIVGLVLGIFALIYFSVCGPAMWHNSLVVCSGGSCTTYTDWKVIGEDTKTGVLEVWAGGRLQRLSNGTWHYE